MAFPGFSFGSNDWGLDTYGGEDGGFSAFGNPPEDWMPDLSGVALPPQPQRAPLSEGDLYQEQEPQPTIAMPTPAQMADLTDEQKKQLRNDLILQVGMAFAQGAHSRGPGLAASLGEAAQNVQGGREQMLAQEDARRQDDWQAQIAEATARQQQAQAEAQGAKERQAANSLAGMANKIADAEPALADLADTYARMGQMDDLASLYQKLPDYAAARAAGFDPLAQPDWRKVVAEQEAQKQKEAQDAADFEEWKKKQEIERGMSREDLRWRQQNGLLFAPPGPREERRPRYEMRLNKEDGYTYRVNVDDPGDVTRVDSLGRQPAEPEKRQNLPRIIEQSDGMSSKKYYEDTEKGVLWPVFPDENGNRTPIPMPGWRPPGARKQSSLDRPREAPTAGPDTRPAASSGEGGKAQAKPSPEQVDRKLSMVRQSFGSLTEEQEAFVRQELQKGMTAQSILARIRMAMQGGPRA